MVGRILGALEVLPSSVRYTHKQYDVYFEPERSCIISNSKNVGLYQGLNQEPSDLETDDKPMFHRASLKLVVNPVI